MKIHIITIGSPKLAYAQMGWQEYLKRLGHYHTVRITHIADKNNDATHLLHAAGAAYKVGLVIEGRELSSPDLATFVQSRTVDSQQSKEICFLIGGPDGLPKGVITACDYLWSFGKLTYPHDLAMVMLAESLYRASTILAGQPYHH
jgi:23S rRNA (pseudouridine1915-N3)-methyltransferase